MPTPSTLPSADEWLKQQSLPDVSDWLKEQTAAQTPEHPGPAAPPRINVKPDTSLAGRASVISRPWERTRDVLNTDVLKAATGDTLPRAYEEGAKGFNDSLNSASDKLGLPRVEDTPILSDIGEAAHKTGGFLANQIEDAFTPRSAITSAIPMAKGSKLVKAVTEGARAGASTAVATDSAPGSAVAGGVGASIPYVGPYISKAVTATRNSAPVQGAVEYLEKQGVPMTWGQRTGRPSLQVLEKHIPDALGGSKAKAFENNQQNQVAGVLANKAAQVSPTNLGEVGAGQAVDAKLGATVGSLKSQADQAYSDIRTTLAQNPTTVQTGQKTSTILGPNGQPQVTPTFQTFQAPVDMNAVRAKLAPIYQELSTAMPPGKRDYSQAYADLKNIMESPATHMSAMDVDKGLSAMKTFIRNGQQSPYLTSKSQATAYQTVNQIESEMNTALAKVDPQLPAKMQQARSLVKQYHTIDDLRSDLPKEPAQLYSTLTRGDDKSYNTLQQLYKVAPDEVKTVGRTYLQGLLDKATSEGGFSRSAGVFADWNRLGDEAKKVMFGPQMTSDLNKIFLGAKTLFPAPGSPTSHNATAVISMLGAGSGLMTMLHMLATGQIGPAGAAAGGVAAQVGGTYALSRILFSPVGAHYMQQVLTQTPGSQTWRAAVGILNAKINAVNQEQQRRAGASDSW